ncbi:MAG: hypothetical protein ACHP7I_05425 [Terriglobales bacterium]
MKKSLIILVLVFAAVAIAQTGADPQAQGGQAAPTGPTIKDPAEYNAYVTALNQADAAAKAQALETFLQQYPNSVVKVGALESLMQTYQQLGNAQKLMDAANRLLQADPNNLRALALMTYLSRQQVEAGGPNAAQSLQQAAQYAQQGMQANQTAPKPAELTAADWEKLKSQTQVIFAGAAGMAALQQKDFPNAQKYLTIAVQGQPNDLRNVYPLALAYLQQKPQDVRGLWYIARAASIATASAEAARAAADQAKAAGRADAPAVAAEAARAEGTAKQLTAYAKGAYTKYHAGNDGWDQLMAQTKTATEPAPGFTVKPAPTPAELASQIMEQKKVADMTFDEIQLVLSSGNQAAADKLWNQLKGQAIKLVGKLITGDASKLMIAGSAEDIEANKADIEVTMAEKIPARIMPKPGEMTFQGTLVSYEANPFMVRMSAGILLDKTGKPLAVPKAAPVHKPPVHKKP